MIKQSDAAAAAVMLPTPGHKSGENERRIDMFKYSVEVLEYSADGVIYPTVIDEFDEPTTAIGYLEICAEGPEGILKPTRGDDMLVSIIDNESGDTLSCVWAGDVYSEWYGNAWKDIIE